jgi:Chromo (CHRromatin Organisation MOdifier) domain
VVQLELPAQWSIHPVFHISLLMPYTETPSHGPNFTRPPPDLIEGEAEYKVEQICSHWTWGRCKTLQYLIKWKGYPESDNTWEDTDQIHAPILIKLYHQTSPQDNLKGRMIRLGEEHSPILSPPKAFSHSPSSPTILRDSIAALVWSRAHGENIRLACSPPAPLVPSLSIHWTHATLPSSSVMSTGNHLTSQTFTTNNDSSPFDPLHHDPDLPIPCLPLPPTTPQTNHLVRHLSSFHPVLTRQCPSHLAPSA